MLLLRIKDKNKEKRDLKTIRICKSAKSNNYEKTLLKRNVLALKTSQRASQTYTAGNRVP